MEVKKVQQSVQTISMMFIGNFYPQKLTIIKSGQNFYKNLILKDKK